VFCRLLVNPVVRACVPCLRSIRGTSLQSGRSGGTALRLRKEALQALALLLKRCQTFPARAACLLQHRRGAPGTAQLRGQKHGAGQR
jgi:hypothetical protein